MNFGWPISDAKFQAAGALLKAARQAFEAEGYEVQTTRVASVSFAKILGPDSIGLTLRMVKKVSDAIAAHGIDYASMGPALRDVPESYEMIPDAIAGSKNVFFSGEMASSERGISLPAIRACADVIRQCADASDDGFTNLRFAALANVAPGGPFFPAAYHDSDTPLFSVAVEAADLAVEAFGNAATIEEGRKALTAAIEHHARKISAAAEPFKFRFTIRFGGIDFSLAPFPADAQSFGAAMERFGVAQAGLHGSLATAAILTDAIDRAEFQRTGFSGLMMPVLEDSILAKRAAEGTLTIKDLLMYSSVCGTGLDTVPLPGDTTKEQIAALLLDISALSLRLHKPLTARLMPVPGKKAGDLTTFDFDYFANSRVLALEAAPLKGLFASDEVFHIHPKGK
jgi:uncharacterized protein (UPF0210 family)